MQEKIKDIKTDLEKLDDYIMILKQNKLDLQKKLIEKETILEILKEENKE